MLRLFLKMLADDAHPTRVRLGESPSPQLPRPRAVDAAATARFPRPARRSRATGSRADG